MKTIQLSEELYHQFNIIRNNKYIYRYNEPNTNSYHQLEFYSQGFLKEKISKLLLVEFESASPHSMSKAREYIFATKKDISEHLQIDQSLYEVMITECLLSKGKASDYGELLLQQMIMSGLMKYIDFILEKKEKWKYQGKKNCQYTQKHLELPTLFIKRNNIVITE